MNASASLAAGSSAQAERQAVNTICQGSAADLVKLAMIQLHKQLQQQLPAESCRLLLQVQYMIQRFEASLILIEEFFPQILWHIALPEISCCPM